MTGMNGWRPRHELAVCAIFRDEAPFLREWIEFHKLQGVGHFFLYDNNSTDDFRTVLEPHLCAGEVTLVDWPHRYAPHAWGADWLEIQSGAYTDCLERFGHDTRWLACIDIDEFLFCPGGEPLPAFLDGYRDFGGLCVNWLLFGTSGYETFSPGKLMIEELTRCAPREVERNLLTKSIVQPRHTSHADNAHAFTYAGDFFAVTADGHRPERARSPVLSIDRIRINHYWTRTESYFESRKILSRGQRRHSDTPEHLRRLAARYNECSDDEILRFVPRLRAALGYDRD